MFGEAAVYLSDWTDINRCFRSEYLDFWTVSNHSEMKTDWTIFATST